MSTFATDIRAAVAAIVRGRQAEIDATIACVLAGGHVLLEGPPGTAKTLLARTIAALAGGTFRRVQFTPDLMPSDIVGTSVFHPKDAEFRFAKGPIFADFVLADELNRAPAKTQAAMLECMEERRVSESGVTHALPEAFTVFATMNPIEFEGTFPLPEAALDRFLARVVLGELDELSERSVIAAYAGGADLWTEVSRTLRPIATPEALLAARAETTATVVEEGVQHYVVDIVRRARKHAAIVLGPSTRAAVGLLRMSRAFARLAGRDFVIPDDCKRAAPYVLAHRMILRPEAQLEGVHGGRVIGDVVAAAPVPRAAA